MQTAIMGLVPLLETIIAHLEAQTKKPEVPIATYEQLYDPIMPGPPEGELVADAIGRNLSRFPAGGDGSLRRGNAMTSSEVCKSSCTASGVARTS